jgi:hypothetical protein
LFINIPVEKVIKNDGYYGQRTKAVKNVDTVRFHEGAVLERIRAKNIKNIWDLQPA